MAQRLCTWPLHLDALRGAKTLYTIRACAISLSATDQRRISTAHACSTSQSCDTSSLAMCTHPPSQPAYHCNGMDSAYTYMLWCIGASVFRCLLQIAAHRCPTATHNRRDQHRHKATHTPLDNRTGQQALGSGHWASDAGQQPLDNNDGPRQRTTDAGQQHWTAGTGQQPLDNNDGQQHWATDAGLQPLDNNDEQQHWTAGAGHQHWTTNIGQRPLDSHRWKTDAGQQPLDHTQPHSYEDV